jgi:PAS domain-containing protein
MIRDITEIKRVETSLRASHAALRKIFDATLDIIVVTRLSDNAIRRFQPAIRADWLWTAGSRRFP